MIDWIPTGSVLVTSVATPPVRMGTVPRAFLPEVKVTVPVGAAAPAEPVTFAERITLAPRRAVCAEEVSVTVAGVVAGVLLRNTSTDAALRPAIPPPLVPDA